MRIGEILVAQNLLRATELARALAEQPHTGGRRLCSLLISRGLLDFDDAARALSAQKRVPCALKKHIDHRDRDLAMELPAALGRAMCALPIARTRSGQLIVAVRDPAPQIESAIAQSVTNFVMIVAPAEHLEAAVIEVYGAVPSDELDVDMNSGPIPVMEPPRPNMALLDPDSIQLALTSLDDDRVSKDPSQSGHSMPAITMPVATRADLDEDDVPVLTEPMPMTDPPPPRETQKRMTLPPAPPSFEATKSALDRARTRDAATDAAMRFIAGKWVAGAVLALRGNTAVGYRGHGDALPKIETIAIPLSKPSTIQRAIETRRTSVAKPASDTQRELEAMFGHPEFPAVTPVLVGGHVVAVIVVGEPILGAGEFEEATSELSLIGEALSEAYERIYGSR